MAPGTEETGAIPTTAVTVGLQEGVAWITLDGPERRNALDAASARALIDACESIDADESIGAAVITGTGRAFCSGADTEALARVRTAAPDQAYELLDRLYSGFRRFAMLTVPTLAVVNGPAVGAGLNLALCADMRVGTPHALFVSGFAPLGIHPGGGHMHLIDRIAGAGAAAHLAVFGRAVRADAALACGLLAEILEEETWRDTVAEMTAHLGRDPELARSLKSDLRRTVIDTTAWDRAMESERARQMWSLARRKEP
ncbi:MAG: enoyl-CoA hydratase-related protein [Candidatus Nanopelagicales bacterium]|jgi:enoyl-CoA hydratase|nr:enoyl-CoA hydratase-related protein [Candidatus Nanopelagicales bacterium]MDP4974484.1 enoyl-CoA hydratase-related protein [Candidatus Nanopelagicales bacterium]